MTVGLHPFRGTGQGATAPTSETVPFDITFTFPFDGSVGTPITQSIHVSIEAPFVAASIGYGLVAAAEDVVFGLGRVEDMDVAGTFNPAPIINLTAPTPILNAPPAGASPAFAELAGRLASSLVLPTPVAGLEALKLGETRTLLGGLPPARLSFAEVLRGLSRALREDVFIERNEIGPATAAAISRGFRLNPNTARAMLADSGAAPLDPAGLASLFATNGGGVDPKDVQFLYALFDDGSGRAFQSDPVLSTAGLGTADGERPFRPFARQIRFEPRATIKLEVTPLTSFHGELHVALHGYRILGEHGSATAPAAYARRQRGRRR